MAGPVGGQADATGPALASAGTAQEKLDATTDPLVLWGAAAHFHSVWFFSPRNPDSRETLDLAKTYATRAKALEPANAEIDEFLLRVDRLIEMQATEPQQDADRPVPPAAFACRAEREYMVADLRDYGLKHPDGGSRPTAPSVGARETPDLFAPARESARRALDGSSGEPGCDAVYRANLVLALIAFREGDRQTAVGHMLDAADASPPRQPLDRLFPGFLESRLTNVLLQYGERESVATFLERSAEGRLPSQRARMLEEAAAIRQGRMPERYQRVMAHR
jgi:hypothetical protein